jgi:hypothetical protein
VSRDRPSDPNKKNRGPQLPQIGKRPTSPFRLLATGVVWIVCGIVALTSLTASWRFIPAIFFIGVGFLWLRGAAVTLSRHERRGGEGR